MEFAEYELVVSQLASAIVQRAERADPDVQYGRSNLIRGNSGFDHQIDVSARLPNVLLLLECKCWHRSIPVEAVLTFIARFIDIRDTMPEAEVIPAIVTTVGYDPGAKVLADHYGIGLEVVRSPAEYSIRYKKYLAVGLAEGSSAGDSWDEQLNARVVKSEPRDDEQ